MKPTLSYLSQAVAATAICATSALAQAPAIFVESTSEQVVTVLGETESLQQLLAEICAKAGVEMRAFGAPDRAVNANYHDVPLDRLFTRLLRTESYAVGMREDSNGATRIAWLRVVGEKTGAVPLPTAAASRAQSGSTAAAPPFFMAAFQATNEKARSTAIDRARSFLVNLEEQRAALMATDPIGFAQQAARYPDARAVMVDLQTGEYTTPVKQKLRAMMTELNGVLRSKERQERRADAPKAG